MSTGSLDGRALLVYWPGPEGLAHMYQPPEHQRFAVTASWDSTVLSEVTAGATGPVSLRIAVRGLGDSIAVGEATVTRTSGGPSHLTFRRLDENFAASAVAYTSLRFNGSVGGLDGKEIVVGRDGPAPVGVLTSSEFTFSPRVMDSLVVNGTSLEFTVRVSGVPHRYRGLRGGDTLFLRDLGSGNARARVDTLFRRQGPLISLAGRR